MVAGAVVEVSALVPVVVMMTGAVWVVLVLMVVVLVVLLLVLVVVVVVSNSGMACVLLSQLLGVFEGEREERGEEMGERG
jgi:hypothetical protein